MADSAPAYRTSLADWRRTLDVNLTGAFLTVKPALAGMARRKSGRIIFIASTAGLKGYPYVAPYVAAKHGVDRPDARAGCGNRQQPASP